MDRTGLLTLVFLGLLAFANAIHHPFVHDDVVFILNNPHIARLDQWAEAFKVPAATGDINTYYRPVLEVLYRLEYQLFGFNPYGFHLVNVIVHVVNGLLLYSLLLRLGVSGSVAWMSSMLFLIHPVQTEAVSCIAGISNLWMAMGLLLALHAYIRRWYTLSLLFFAEAFLSKEQAIMFVPLAFVIDLFRGQRHWRWWAASALTAIALLWLRQAITGASLVKDIVASPGELYLRLEAIPRVLGMDVRLIFFPNDLHYYRSIDILQPNGLAWILFLLSLGGIFYVFRRWPKARGVMALGFGWFLATLFPVLNIAPLINEYSFILTAEHFLYLPIVGIFIMVVSLADHFLTHVKKMVAVLVIVSCLLLTWQQNTYWQSEIVLFNRMLVFEPNFGRGHLLLAKAYFFNFRYRQADVEFRKAFAIISGYERKAANAPSKAFYQKLLAQIRTFEPGL